jgi:hypothetical protein
MAPLPIDIAADAVDDPTVLVMLPTFRVTLPTFLVTFLTVLLAIRDVDPARPDAI